MKKSTFSSLPTYYLSHFPLPDSIAQRVENLQRDYLWRKLEDELKFHLVNWTTVCQPIQRVELGIQSMLCFYQALLGIWLWHYAIVKEAFWCAVIDSKHGSLWGSWTSGEASGNPRDEFMET